MTTRQTPRPDATAGGLRWSGRPSHHHRGQAGRRVHAGCGLFAASPCSGSR